MKTTVGAHARVGCRGLGHRPSDAFEAIDVVWKGTFDDQLDGGKTGGQLLVFHVAKFRHGQGGESRTKDIVVGTGSPNDEGPTASPAPGFNDSPLAKCVERVPNGRGRYAEHHRQLVFNG